MKLIRSTEIAVVSAILENNITYIRLVAIDHVYFGYHRSL